MFVTFVILEKIPPSRDFVTITGEVGSIVTIKNLIGGTIKILKLYNENHIVQIDNLDCGLYLISDDKGNVVKLIIAR